MAAGGYGGAVAEGVQAAAANVTAGLHEEVTGSASNGKGGYASTIAQLTTARALGDLLRYVPSARSESSAAI